MATTTAHEIKVFAMFPTNPEWTSWNWVHCLTFQPDILIRCNFSLKPYKWMRYAIGVVVGAQGHLSFKPDNHEDVMNYDDDLQLKSAVLYYHTTQNERRMMFPADPDIMDHTSITSSDATTQRVNFSNGVVARDGVCVLTGYSVRICKAAHLLPHSKGDSYIYTYTQRCSRDAVNSIVHEINSVRNGILLNRIAHTALGRHIAFLVTPNFAMSSTDVDPTLQPTEKRHTAHLFDPDSPEYFGEHTVHSGSAVRMCGAADQQPPDVLFDLVYASAVLHSFAPQSMRDALQQWKSTFYLGGITDAAQSSHQATVDSRQATAKIQRKNEQDRARDERAARRANNRGDYFDYLTILPHILIPPDELEAFLGKAAEERAERERGCLEDKVGGWAREVANACR